MASKSKKYIWQSVIGLGFLSGLWTTIGIDPEQIVIGALSNAADVLYPNPDLRYLFILLPTILLLVSIYSAHKKGKVLRPHFGHYRVLSRPADPQFNGARAPPPSRCHRVRVAGDQPETGKKTERPLTVSYKFQKNPLFKT